MTFLILLQRLRATLPWATGTWASTAWEQYAWGQAPGQPWVHGLQNSECDFNDHRYSKLIIITRVTPSQSAASVDGRTGTQ